MNIILDNTMIFVIEGLVYNLEVIYYDDTIAFIFTDDNRHKLIMAYWSIYHGGHQHYNENYKNGQSHGTQYSWFSIQEGGHQHYIANYQNGQKHGVHYGWWRIRDGGHLRYIENYQNDHPWGIQYHWRTDKICHIKTY